jgi:hypothetical protein
VLRKEFRPKRDKITGEWKRLHKEELYDLYSSTNTIRVIESRRRWSGLVAHMGAGEIHTGFWWGDMMARDNLEDLGVEGGIILKRILIKWDGGMDWVDLAQDRDR